MDGVTFAAESESLLSLQGKIFEKTKVPISKQKLIIKGKIIHDDAALRQLLLGSSTTVMLMGSAEGGIFDSIQLPTEPAGHAIENLVCLPYGFTNPSTFCYANSILQSLFHLHSDISFLLAESNEAKEAKNFSEAIKVLYAKYQERNPTELNQKVLSTLLIVMAFGLVAPSQEGNRANRGPSAAINVSTKQQDAEEFLGCVLDSFPLLRDCFSFEMEQSTLPTRPTDSQPTVSQLAKHSKLGAIIESGHSNLWQCIDSFLNSVLTKPDGSGDAEFVQRSKFSSTPKFLAVQLMRFCYRRDTERSGKVFKKIEFPLQLSIPASSCLESVPLTQRDFTLFSVITHRGRSLDSGHYISWCRQENGKSDSWLQLNDEAIEPVLESQILSLSGGTGDSHMAYLLFYRRNDVSYQEK